jgi:hypothetical protein
MKLSRGPTSQESHEAPRARIIEAVNNRDASVPVHRLVVVRDWVTSLWHQKKWIHNSRECFWIVVVIALIALCILAILSKVSHPQPQYNDWLPH